MTISIEHVKPSENNSDLITLAQQAASFHLIRNIIARNTGIRKAWADSNGGITGHFSMSPVSRERCPGPFPWNELFNYLNGGDGEENCYGTVNSTSGLNIRTQPNSQSSIVGAIPSGQTVQLLSRHSGESINGDPTWFRVSKGYVSGYWLRINPEGPSWCY